MWGDWSMQPSELVTWLEKAFVSNIIHPIIATLNTLHGLDPIYIHVEQIRLMILRL